MDKFTTLSLSPSYTFINLSGDEERIPSSIPTIALLYCHTFINLSGDEERIPSIVRQQLRNILVLSSICWAKRSVFLV